MSPNDQLSSVLPELRKTFNLRKKEFLDDYFTFLKFPSISTEPGTKTEVLQCADWVANYIKKMGLEVEVWPTGRYPIIFASYNKAGVNQPTLLIYQHYDVQSVDPLTEWHSPPFEPTIRDGEVFARGAQDNKGQCFYSLLAIKLLLELTKKLPINIKLCIEGDEEVGSAELASILKEKASSLKADYLAVVDSGIPAKNRPAITLGVRGVVAMEMSVQGSFNDLHSGAHGGMAYNPIQALVEILASLRDDKGRVTIPGFYDDVIELSKTDREAISWTFDETEYKEMFGIDPQGGEKAFSAKERNWIRPTFEINGIYGGYTGTGFKTVIPAKAYAKFSCRLVPNQSPEKICQLVARHIEKKAPKGVKVEVKIHPGGGSAIHAKQTSQGVQAFAKAFSEIYQLPCEFVYEGGSIPIVAKLTEACQAELILMGLGLNEDQIHAPNEHFGLDRLEKGLQIMARGMELLRK